MSEDGIFLTYMKPPTLPEAFLRDGKLYIDNSGMEGILRCQRFGQYNLIHRRRLATPAVEQAFGRAIHAALEVRYKVAGAKAPDDAVKMLMQSALEEHFSGITLPEEEWRNLGRAQELIAAYNEQYADEPFEVIATEWSHQRPLGFIDIDMHGRIDVIWQGRFDGILSYEGKYRVRDFKTTCWDKDPSDKFRVSSQLIGYCFLISDPFLPFGQVRATHTDQLIYRKPLAKVTKSAAPRNECNRLDFTFTDRQIAEWRADTLTEIKAFFESLYRTADGKAIGAPKRRTACAFPTRCPYYDVCTIDEPEQARQWLNGSNYTDNHWNPMTGSDAVPLGTAAEINNLTA